MKVKTRCEHCGKIYNMSDEYIGQTAQCKVCQKHFLMTVLEEAPPTPPPAPPAAGRFEAPAPAGGQYQGFGAPQSPLPGQAPAFGAPQSPPPGQAPAFGAPQAPPGQAPAFGTPQVQPPAFGAPQFAPPAGYDQPPQFGVQPPAGPAFGVAPDFGQPPNFGTQPAFQDQRFGAAPPPASPVGAPQPGQTPPTPTQTVVCPKCKFTAEIPPVSSNMRIRCQECGKKFVIKPLRKGKAPAPPKAAKSGAGGSKKSVLVLLFIVLLLAAVVFVGPTFLPDLIPNLLPF